MKKSSRSSLNAEDMRPAGSSKRRGATPLDGMAKRRPEAEEAAQSDHDLSRRHRRNAEQCATRREVILQKAIDHFAAVGYPNADVGAIAESAGCAKGTIYLHFKSKDELFRASVDHVMQGLIQALQRDESMDAICQIRYTVNAYLTYFDAHPNYIELLIQERAVFKDRQRPTFFEYRMANRERGRRVLALLSQDGRMRQIPADRVLDVVGDLLYGTIFTNYFAGRRKSLTTQAEDILDMLFHGLLEPGADERDRGPASPASGGKVEQ